MQNLILLRGLPGSGKSTVAKLFGDSPCHYEADMFFIDERNVYRFEPTKLKDAHNWCRHKTMEAMKAGHPTVIVSNTFTQEWEMEVYYVLAEELGYQVHSLIVENRHNGVNVHNVPEEKLQAMKDRFEVKL
jgi:predicted kinase